MAGELLYRTFVTGLFLAYVARRSIVNGSTATVPQSTTTVSTTTATAAATTTTASPTVVPPDTAAAYCMCNLKPNQCDVNCCCDPDCTSSDRLTFSFCIDQLYPANIDDKACIQNSVLFTNNTPYTVQTTQSGLFCVYFDNYNSANYFNVPTLVTDEATFQQYVDLYGSYQFNQSYNAWWITVVKMIATTYYVTGDPVLTVYNPNSLGNGTLGTLALPASAGSSVNCINSNPAAYLISGTNSCTQPLVGTSIADWCVNTTMLNAETYYSGFKIVGTPAILQLPSNVTVSPGVPLYDSPELRTVEPINPRTVSYVAGVCQNAVIGVEYNIAYGGTSGIGSVTVQFTYANLTASVRPLTQNFTTNFYQNGSVANTTAYSGNPGYVVGKPVRAGNISGSTVTELDLSMVSSTVTGLCSDNVQDRVPVKFGINMRSGCFISFSYSNMSSLCNESQFFAVDALLGSSPPTVIASFGNTQLSSTQNWTTILQSVPSSCSLNDIPSGTTATTGQCKYIITGMNLQIIYANVGALNNPQPSIIGAERQFYCQNVLSFQCVGPYCQPSTVNSTSQKFEIFSSVNFIDASSPAVGVSGVIPQVSSTLPADFFYPFT